MDSGTDRSEHNLDARIVVKMNKIILMLISFALMASVAMADTGMQPCPLAFKFLTSPPGAEIGLGVQILYQGNVVYDGSTNEYGELVVDVGSQGIPNCMSQNFKLQIKGCSDAVCSQDVSFNPNGYTTIDLRSINLFGCPTCPDIKCPECVCPECPTDQQCSYAWCEDNGFIKPVECPVKDTTVETVFIAIVTLIAGLGIGKYGLGVKVYTNTKGEVIKQHKHKNTTGYHDSNIIHRIQPHKKGEMTPNYSNEKDPEGHYKYIG